jgi:hypothetical protein
MVPGIRKIAGFQEEVLRDLRTLGAPFRHVIVAAVMDNPWHGKGFVEDLSPIVREMAGPLGRLLARKAVQLLGGADAVQAFGKAAMVGLEGEYEHANALIHTTLFGDECRKAAGGSAWMVGNQKICPTGSILELPMAHKTDAKLQNYYHTISLYIPDAPRAHELVVAVGMASGPRPHGRLGTGT